MPRNNQAIYPNFSLLMSSARITLVSTLILLTVACGSGGSANTDDQRLQPQPTPPETPKYAPKSPAFVHMSPEDAGFDSEILQAAYTLAESQNSLKSLLVVKDNHLIAEQYFNQTSSDALLHVRSVTKTVVALITGIALEQNIISSLDQTIGEFLLDEYPWMSEQKANIQLKHLLTMSSGFEWRENDLYDEWVKSSNPGAFLLSRTLEHPPGTRFQYNSAGVHLLAKILFKASQGRIVDITINHLFTPLGIDSFEWDRLKDDLFNGGAGLQLSAIAQAKLGQVLLNKGRYIDANGLETRILAEHWLEETFHSKVNMSSRFGSIDLSGYGYLTWQGNIGDRIFHFAWGWGGQFILIFPDVNMVVIANNEWRVDGETADQQEQATLAIIVDGILPALSLQ